MAPNAPRHPHDRSYRLLFAQPRMVEDLLRRFLAEAWSEELDFSSLEQVNASHVSDGLDRRDGDIAWRLRFRSAPVHLYLLVEFQSDVQRFMALRQATYLMLFYQRLVDQGQLTPEGLLPPVLLSVIYNGKVRWSAPAELSDLVRTLDGGAEVSVPRLSYRLLEMEAVGPDKLGGRNLVALLIRLERSRTRAALRAVIRNLVAALPAPEDGRLRRAFVVWLQRVLLPARGEENIPELVDLKEFRIMLIETVEEWSRENKEKWLKKGRKEGRQAGLEEGLEKGRQDLLLRQMEVKFGPLDERTKARVGAAGAERLLQWAERLMTAEQLSDVFRCS